MEVTLALKTKRCTPPSVGNTGILPPRIDLPFLCIPMYTYPHKSHNIDQTPKKLSSLYFHLDILGDLLPNS